MEMKVIELKKGDSMMIGDNKIEVMSVTRAPQVRLGVETRRKISITRKEVKRKRQSG